MKRNDDMFFIFSFRAFRIERMPCNWNGVIKQNGMDGGEESEQNESKKLQIFYARNLFFLLNTFRFWCNCRKFFVSPSPSSISLSWLEFGAHAFFFTFFDFHFQWKSVSIVILMKVYFFALLNAKMVKILMKFLNLIETNCEYVVRDTVCVWYW